jgi:hypothetical protein
VLGGTYPPKVGRHWSGIDIYPAPATVYNPPMIVDDKTIVEPGLQSGTGNSMRLGETKDGRTLLQFLECTQVTDNHADRAKVVSEVQLDNRDLPGLIKLFTDRLAEIDS